MDEKTEEGRAPQSHTIPQERNWASERGILGVPREARTKAQKETPRDTDRARDPWSWGGGTEIP